MLINKEILLPGSGLQLELLLNEVNVESYSILVMGSGSEFIAQTLAEKTGKVVELIVEDYDSLINSKLLLKENETVNIKLMDFDATDFEAGTFDLIYAQASVSSGMRNKIIKEIKRTLKPGGYFCVGEITKLTKHVPQFVDNIFMNSDLVPLFKKEISNYYKERKFEIIFEKDISPSLQEYFKLSSEKFDKTKETLSDKEKAYHKKLLSKISHETKAYLKQGADKYIGFEVIIMKK